MILKTPRPRSLRPSKKAPSRKGKVLAEKILKEGAARVAQSAAQVATALAVRRAQLTEAELESWQRDLEQRLDKIQEHPEQNLGFIEEELARRSREPLRLLVER